MNRFDSASSWSAPYTILGDSESATGPFVFTCEHASNDMGPITPSKEDNQLLESHWGWDIGTAELVKALVDRTSSVGVLAGYSRLVVDTNRRTDSDTLVVSSCGSQAVSFNQNLSEAAIKERIEHVYTPYHQAVDRTMGTRLARGPVHLVSVHSFTPHWPGQDRSMHVGVLFDRYVDSARRLRDALEKQGLVSVLNAPYSGLAGELMFGASHNGGRHGVPYLELEIRQDLISHEALIADMADRLWAALKVFQPAPP